MCSEPKGLSGWPRAAARWLAVFTAAAIALGILFANRVDRRVGAGEVDSPSPALAPNSPNEPIAKVASLAKSAEFLDKTALNWTRDRDCGACHTNYAYLMARPAVGSPDASALIAIREFFEDRVKHWDDAPNEAKPKWDAEVIATATALALNDAASTKTLHPMTRKALDRIWTLQKDDGSWDWLKAKLPPLEYDDYYGAVFAAVGVSVAPDGYAQTESAKAGLVKLKSYFQSNPSPNLHHKAFLLWASNGIDGLMTTGEQKATQAQLLALQRPDGGWSLPSLGRWDRRDGTPNDRVNSPSDGYGTGLVVYVLRQTGVPANDPALLKAADWLKSNQRESGRWFTRSLNNDKAHYITHAGTSFAALALKACE